MEAIKNPIRDGANAKRPTKPGEIAVLENYRDQLGASLDNYAADMQARSDRDDNTYRKATYSQWAESARQARTAIDAVDSCVAWKSVYSSPETADDIARLLSGEVALTSDHGTAVDPIPYFVRMVKAAMKS